MSDHAGDRMALAKNTKEPVDHDTTASAEKHARADAEQEDRDRPKKKVKEKKVSALRRMPQELWIVIFEWAFRILSAEESVGYANATIRTFESGNIPTGLKYKASPLAKNTPWRWAANWGVLNPLLKTPIRRHFPMVNFLTKTDGTVTVKSIRAEDSLMRGKPTCLQVFTFDHDRQQYDWSAVPTDLDTGKGIWNIGFMWSDTHSHRGFQCFCLPTRSQPRPVHSTICPMEMARFLRHFPDLKRIYIMVKMEKKDMFQKTHGAIDVLLRYAKKQTAPCQFHDAERTWTEVDHGIAAQYTHAVNDPWTCLKDAKEHLQVLPHTNPIFPMNINQIRIPPGQLHIGVLVSPLERFHSNK